MEKEVIKPATKISKMIAIIRWNAYITSGLLFLLWGSFFVEHLTWFFSPGAVLPPWHVWLLQAVHLALLIGYLLVYKWPKIACVVIPISAAGFFAAAAGRNFIPFLLVSLIPVFLLFWIRSLEKKIPVTIPKNNGHQ